MVLLIWYDSLCISIILYIDDAGSRGCKWILVIVRRMLCKNTGVHITWDHPKYLHTNNQAIPPLFMFRVLFCFVSYCIGGSTPYPFSNGIFLQRVIVFCVGVGPHWYT